MVPAKAVFTRETFQFFKDLSRHNRKEWMDANRDRYQAALVQPLRRLQEELAPTALELDSRFDTSGRTGANFSRINRDIRFAKDKTLYKTHMYLKFSVPAPGKRETGQLYVGLSVETVTAGFRIYSGGKRKESTLALIAEPRVNADSGWVAKQKKRLGRRGPPRRRIGKRFWHGSSAENSRPLRPRARHFRAKRPRSFAISTRCCASLRCRKLKYSVFECIFLLHLRQQEEESPGRRGAADIPKRLTLYALSHTMPHVASMCFSHA